MKRFLPLIGGVMVFGATLLPYLQTFRFDFSNMDDYSYVLLSPVHRGFTAEGIRWSFNGDSAALTANWHPLTFLSLMFDNQFWGPDAGVMHVHNALLHAANGVLLFLFLLQLIRLLGRSNVRVELAVLSCGLTALFWTLHPLRVESVAWISQRKDVLFLFFELLACMAWLKYLTAERFRDKLGWCLISCVCFVLAFAGKPMAVMFPVLAALLEWFVKKRIIGNVYWGLLAMACVFVEITRVVQTQGGALSALMSVPFGYRLVNAAVSIGGYLWKTIYPVDLYLPYMYRYPAPPDFLMGGLCICGIVLALGVFCFLVVWRKNVFVRMRFWEPLFGRIPFWVAKLDESASILCFGFLWFVVSLIPVLGFEAIGYAAHADRYTYLPSIGLAVVMVWLPLWSEHTSVRILLLFFLMGWVAVIGRHGFVQIAYWRNDHTLFVHVLEQDENNPIAHRNLGIDYMTHGNPDHAVYHFGRAVGSGFEYNRSIHLFYIYMLLETGKIEKAEKETLEFSRYVDSLRKYSDEDYLGGENRPATTMVDPLIGFALVAAHKGDFVLAHAHIDPLCQGFPTSMDVKYAKALITEKEGNLEEALRLYYGVVLEEEELPMSKFVRGHIRRLEKVLQTKGNKHVGF